MASDDERKRVYARLSSDDYQRMKYWAHERGQSDSEFIECAVQEYIAHINGNYDMPTLEQQRLNQLTDAIVELISSHHALSAVVSNGFRSLISMARGDNYLLDMDVGDFDLDEDDTV